jgi:hypothetical protein
MDHHQSRRKKMLEMILLLTALNPISVQTAQVQTCVWPHPCKAETVAQLQPCVWPNVCKSEEAPAPVLVDLEVAQVQTCVWPNPCKGVTTCQYPNKCS